MSTSFAFNTALGVYVAATGPRVSLAVTTSGSATRHSCVTLLGAMRGGGVKAVDKVGERIGK